MGDQMVFKRYEMKYLLTKEQRDYIQQEMSAHMIPDIHGKNTLLSLYLDTPDFLLIRRSIDKPVYKEKLRMRSYGMAKNDTEVFLELKKKYDGVVYKRREAMTLLELERYLKTGTLPRNTQIMRELDFAMKRYRGIAPAVLLSYEREAFYDKDNHEFRMTFDENILWRTDELALNRGIYGAPVLAPNQVLLEIKTADAVPLWLVQLMSQMQIRGTSFSKYASAYRSICTRPNTNDIQTDGGIYHYA
jgi:SPX domain protein involved in polyphosphate accumulation